MISEAPISLIIHALWRRPRKWLDIEGYRTRTIATSQPPANRTMMSLHVLLYQVLGFNLRMSKQQSLPCTLNFLPRLMLLIHIFFAPPEIQQSLVHTILLFRVVTSTQSVGLQDSPLLKNRPFLKNLPSMQRLGLLSPVLDPQSNHRSRTLCHLV